MKLGFGPERAEKEGVGVLSVISRIRDMYLAFKKVCAGKLRTQEVLQDHKIVLKVCQHHAIGWTLSEGDNVYCSFKGGVFQGRRLIETNFLHWILPRSCLGGRRIRLLLRG